MDRGREIPTPSATEKVRENNDWEGWTLGFVDISKRRELEKGSVAKKTTEP